MVETVDSAKLASALSSSWAKQNKQNPLNIMVQVNTSEEDSKYIYFSIIIIIIIIIIVVVVVVVVVIIIIIIIIINVIKYSLSICKFYLARGPVLSTQEHLQFYYPLHQQLPPDT